MLFGHVTLFIDVDTNVQNIVKQLRRSHTAIHVHYLIQNANITTRIHNANYIMDNYNAELRHLASVTQARRDDVCVLSTLEKVYMRLTNNNTGVA